MKRPHGQPLYASPKLQRGWDDLGGGSNVGPGGKQWARRNGRTNDLT